MGWLKMIQLQTDKVAYQTGYDEGFQNAISKSIEAIRREWADFPETMQQIIKTLEECGRFG